MCYNGTTYHRDHETIQLCSNNNIELQYIHDTCLDSCPPPDVGMFGPIRMQCNAEFKQHASVGGGESHRKLSIKHEAFVKAWKHLPKQTWAVSRYTSLVELNNL